MIYWSCMVLCLQVAFQIDTNKDRSDRNDRTVISRAKSSPAIGGGHGEWESVGESVGVSESGSCSAREEMELNPCQPYCAADKRQLANCLHLFYTNCSFISTLLLISLISFFIFLLFLSFASSFHFFSSFLLFFSYYCSSLIFLLFIFILFTSLHFIYFLFSSFLSLPGLDAFEYG